MIHSNKICLALGILASAFPLATVHAGPAPAADPKHVVEEGPDAAKLWAQNCTRCHNLRPAKSFSDAQWDIIVHHMRIRGNITGSDARAIAEFLKGAN